ncbi:hypothetical protein [uncultured Desulfosarcina sp.]|uniref:hypothetical protein n=1 Tax=uncultured Desulfosarcina sp. TaxID=218289 RepID=UPI0029C865D1|nr:hypothetical protein [uncultured Desulfosarcina sp.]
MKIRLMPILCCLWWVIPAASEALTANEILQLKQNGVSEETIQMMLQSEMQAQSQKGSSEGETMGIKTITRPGGQPAIVYSTGSGGHDVRDADERLKEEQAWEMLRHVIVDTR